MEESISGVSYIDDPSLCNYQSLHQDFFHLGLDLHNYLLMAIATLVIPSMSTLTTTHVQVSQTVGTRAQILENLPFAAEYPQEAMIRTGTSAALEST